MDNGMDQRRVHRQHLRTTRRCRSSNIKITRPLTTNTHDMRPQCRSSLGASHPLSSSWIDGPYITSVPLKHNLNGNVGIWTASARQHLQKQKQWYIFSSPDINDDGWVNRPLDLLDDIGYGLNSDSDSFALRFSFHGPEVKSCFCCGVVGILVVHA